MLAFTKEFPYRVEMAYVGDTPHRKDLIEWLEAEYHLVRDIDFLSDAWMNLEPIPSPHYQPPLHWVFDFKDPSMATIFKLAWAGR